MQEELYIIVAAAEVGEVGNNIPDFEEADESTQRVLHEALADTQPIEVNERRLFKICFHDYIIYQIRNESFCSGDPHEVRYVKYLITFEKSKLLSHLEEITDAQQLEDGSFNSDKWIHYGIYTQNHVIDVISHCSPVVSHYTKRN